MPSIIEDLLANFRGNDEDDYEEMKNEDTMELTFDKAKDTPLTFAAKQVKKVDKTAFNNAIYGGVTPDGGTQYWQWGCHAKMRSLPIKTSVVWSAWMPQESQKIASDNFFDWITSDNSPWKLAFDLGMSFSEKKFFNRDFWKTGGFIFDKLDKIPSNLLQNFLIASRIPKEHPHVCAIWNKLVVGGLTPEMALVMASNFPHYEDSGRRIAYYNDIGDYPLYAVRGYEPYIKNFCTHKFWEEKFNPPYSMSHSYTPVNVIWGPIVGVPDHDNPSKQYGLMPLGSKNMLDCVLGQYALDKIGTLQNQQSSFGRSGRDNQYVTWSCTEKEIIQIGLLEEKRIGL